MLFLFVLVWGLLPLAASAAAALFPRENAAKMMPEDKCIDLDNFSPPNLKWGFPAWRSYLNPNCPSPFPVDENGSCAWHMNPVNNCNAFCQTANAWYFGSPIDMMGGRWCEPGDPCQRSIEIKTSDGVTVEEATSSGQRTEEVHAKDSTQSFGLGFNLGLEGPSIDSIFKAFSPPADAKPKVKPDAGAAPAAAGAVPKRRKRGAQIGPVAAALLAFKPSMSLSGDFKTTFSEKWVNTVGWESAISKGNAQTHTISVARTETYQKPSYAANHCGSWYVVPILGLSCGVGVSGELEYDKASNASYCLVKPHGASEWGHCFPYAFVDDQQHDTVKHRLVFALRSCEDGRLLPGEFQPPAFREAMSGAEYADQHITRFGWVERDAELFGPKPRDDAWVRDAMWKTAAGGGGGPPGTRDFVNGTLASHKVIGPEDYTIKVCDEGGYCVRERLTDGECYDFPRGYFGAQSVNVATAQTTHGNCCTLFSRHECHGLAQNVKGAINNMASIGFTGKAHSVICNVAEYCDANRLDLVVPGLYGFQ